MLTKSMGHIDFANSANEIERLIRGLKSMAQVLFTYINKKMLKIWDADVVESIEDIKVPQNSVVRTALISKEKDVCNMWQWLS